jgi:prepilin-type N-terminal cleavage/methylation domain-containing protein
MHKIHNHYQRGFTLIEVIVASFILTILVGISAIFFVYFFKNYNFSFEQNRSLDDAQSSINKLITELKEAKTSESGAYPLLTTNDQEITFFADIDNDGKVEQVRYFLDNTQLKRGLIEPEAPPLIYDPAKEKVVVITDDVRNSAIPLFYYYNGDWPGDIVNNPLAAGARLLNTRLVKVNLIINTNPGLQKDFNISSEVMIRNLKTN